MTSSDFDEPDFIDLREELANLCAEHDAFDRPSIMNRARIEDWGRTIEAAKAWDAAHQVEAARREWIVSRIDEINAALKRLAAERMHSHAAIAAMGALETPAVLALREWLRGDLQWCVMTGATGLGKTMAFRSVLTRHNQMVVRAIDLVRFVFDCPRERAQMLSCAVLAVDDVGTEGDGEGPRRALWDILDARHEAGRRTAVSSNLSREGLASHLDPRVLERIRHKVFPIRLTGASLRIPKKKK